MDKELLIKAMEEAGYTIDIGESRDNYLRFWGECSIMTFDSWKDCEDWLEQVVFDDPEVSDRVEYILHPERFSEN